MEPKNSKVSNSERNTTNAVIFHVQGISCIFPICMLVSLPTGQNNNSTYYPPPRKCRRQPLRQHMKYLKTGEGGEGNLYVLHLLERLKSYA